MIHDSSKKSTLVIVSIFAFVSIVGVNLPSPICALLFLDPVRGLLPGEYLESTRMLALGIMMASYSFSGLIGGLILGLLWNKLGSKKIFILSSVGFTIGYVISAIGINYKQIFVLIFGRIIIGFFSGIAFIAQAAVVDINSSKLQNFCYFSIFYSLGFVIGPLLGGFLSDSSIQTWFNLSTPFWFGAIMTPLMIAPVLFLFKDDSFSNNDSLSFNFSFYKEAKEFMHVFAANKTKIIFCSYFLFNLGWSLLTVFYPVYLNKKFQFQEIQLALVFSYLALWQASAQFAIAKFSKHWKFTRSIQIFLILLAVTVYMLSYVEQTYSLIWVLPLTAIFYGGSFTFFSILLTTLADIGEEGKYLGIGLFISFFAQIISPLIPWAAAINDISIVILIGVTCFFVAGIVLLKNKFIYT